jgi:hypothetical protein
MLIKFKYVLGQSITIEKLKWFYGSIDGDYMHVNHIPSR